MPRPARYENVARFLAAVEGNGAAGKEALKNGQDPGMQRLGTLNQVPQHASVPEDVVRRFNLGHKGMFCLEGMRVDGQDCSSHHPLQMRK